MPANTRPRLTTLLALLTVSSLTPILHATDYTWIGSSGNWSDPAKWQNGLIPVSSTTDDIFISTGNSTTVTSDHDPWILHSLSFAGSSNFTLNASNSLGLQFGGNAPFISRPATPGNFTIAAPITAQGTLTFGSSSTTGFLALTNTANQFASVIVNNIQLIAASPAALAPTDITLNGGTLSLLNGVNGNPRPIANYPATITVNQAATIADHNSKTTLLQTSPISLNSVNLNAPVTFNFSNANLTAPPTGSSIATLNVLQPTSASFVIFPGHVYQVSNLALSADFTVNVDFDLNSSPNNGVPVTFANVTESGPRAISVHGGPFSDSVEFQSTYNATGPISLSRIILLFNANSSTSSSPLTVHDSVNLTGAGTIHRPVTFDNNPDFPSSLSPGTTNPFTFTSSSATLTLDALTLSPTTTLQWNLGAPYVLGGNTNDLVQVLGDLTLDGSLNVTHEFLTFGTYTLLTYAGTLTDNGLILPTSNTYKYSLDVSTPNQILLNVNPIPEPTTALLLTLPTLTLLLPRRRRRQQMN